MADGCGGSVRSCEASLAPQSGRCLAMSADPEYPDIQALRAAKVKARAHARAVRAKAYVTTPDAPTRVRDVFVRELLPKLALQPGSVVTGYVPFGDELDPRPLLAALEERGCQLGAPAIVERDRPLVFRRWDVYAGLAPGRFGFGIPEPSPESPVVEPDVLLVPMLAFDRRGHRLGYGRGYYDRTLALWRGRRPVVAAGLAFAAQEVLSLPIGGDDQRLDWIITEAGLIRPTL
jgi:5-formyltetrahydrofolate cyclo-ligase